MTKAILTLVFSLVLLSGFTQVRVACVGNSITEGAAIADGKKYPQALQQLLGNGYSVRNFGVGGRTLLQRGDFPYRNEAAFRDALNWQPDIVVIKLCTNDSKPQNWKYAGDFQKDYRDLVRAFRKSNPAARIYICRPLPVFKDNWGIRDSIVRNGILPQVARVARKNRTRLIDLYGPFEGKAHLTYDGIHPNAEGAALLAQLVYQAIR
jgi:acyl-CoA thioesterase I